MIETVYYLVRENRKDTYIATFGGDNPFVPARDDRVQIGEQDFIVINRKYNPEQPTTVYVILSLIE